MKKRILASVLLVGLISTMLTPFTLANAEETTDETNLAIGAEVIYATYSHNDDYWNWHTSNINDGNPINGSSGGCSGGYHSAYGSTMPDPQYIGYNFGEAKTFNTVVIYPTGTNTFPVDFEIQVSDDGENWTAVVSETDYAIVSDQEIWNPQTFTFETRTAQYVRLYATKLNNDGSNYAMKLTEMEVYNRSSATVSYVNLAVNKPVTSDSSHTDGGWLLEHINDGDTRNIVTNNLDYGQFAGYHTNPSTPRDGGDDAHAQFTIELGEGTVFNRVVVYPANTIYSIRPEDHNGVFFPANFEIQVSDDGENWTTVREETGYTVDSVAPQVFDFDTQTATYIRFYMKNLTDYIKLSEFEVYDTTKPVLATDSVSAFVSTRAADNAKFDMRFILATDETTVQTGDTVTITFYDEDGNVVKAVIRTIGEEMVAGQTMALYEEVSAAGNVYTAAEGCRIFGCVVTGIPQDGFTTVTMNVTRDNGQKVMADASMQNPYLAE